MGFGGLVVRLSACPVLPSARRDPCLVSSTMRGCGNAQVFRFVLGDTELCFKTLREASER